jgi:hypothetical protein
MLQHPELTGIPVLILGNKKDLASMKDIAALTQQIHVRHAAAPSSHASRVMTISALTM